MCCFRTRPTALQKTLVILGVLLVLVGLGWPWLSKLPLGRLPGDIVIDRENFRFYFPLTTMIVISVLVSAVLWADSEIGDVGRRGPGISAAEIHLRLEIRAGIGVGHCFFHRNRAVLIELQQRIRRSSACLSRPSP